MGEILRHKKTGGLYEVVYQDVVVNCAHALCDDDKIQIVRNPDEKTVEVWPAHWQTEFWEVLAEGRMQTSVPLNSGNKVVVYQGLSSPSLVWARRASEMNDGRFEPAQAIEARQGRDAEGGSVEDESAVTEGDVLQPLSSTPGEAERLVENIVRAARDCGEARERGDEECLAIAERHEAAARTALLSHISTAGRGEGSAPDWIVEFVRAAANTVAQTTLPGSALREVAERAFAWAVIEGQALSADATNPQNKE